MTWSIIAKDSATGQFGIAVATKFFAVGARVPHIAAGHGAIATQALVNPYYGIDGVKMLREGRSPRDTIVALTAADSIAGNMLAGAQVLDETAKAYLANETLPFARRLIAALRAGEAAGGDKRGKQSAALLIHDSEEWSALDLRVDDHADPLGELERLERVSRERWVHFRQFLPTRQNPAGITDRATIDAGIATGLASER